MELQYVNFIAVAVLAAIVGVMLVVVHVSLKKMRCDLAHLREELTLWQKAALGRSSEDISRDSGEVPGAEGYAQISRVVDLPPADEAQMRERLQQGSVASGEAPERYRHVATLMDKGLAAEEIAQVLQISETEAQQLVKLAEVGRKNS